MKQLKLSSLITLVVLFFGFMSCKKESPTSPLVKSASLSIGAKLRSNAGARSGSTVSVSSALVNISGLSIEENSGNDGQNNTGGEDKNESSSGSENNETDQGDITLNGPFTLDISSGSAVIGNVDVYPGTYKKVNFSFAKNSNSPFNGSSIVITGMYKTQAGSEIPFTLSSDFIQKVQLPLSGNGVSVTSNSQVPINIVFDIESWLGELDFSGATVQNGNILINSTNNISLLTAFEAKVSSYIDAEKE